VDRKNSWTHFSFTAVFAGMDTSLLASETISSTNESFNGKFRDECLAMNWFHSQKHAQVLIEPWRQHYNTVRPHSSLDYLTPFEYVSGWENSSTTGACVSR
jgi:putative transposase